MRRLFIFFSFISAGASIISCSDQKTGPEKTVPADSLKVCKKDDPINPNGSSELAILMREMTALTDSVNHRLLSGRPIGPYPEKFEAILTARPTDSTINEPVFMGFANNYLDKLKGLYANEKGDLIPPFNTLVNSCITCHENFCQGPIKRIRKMVLAGGSR
jgi:hypothetical protein